MATVKSFDAAEARLRSARLAGDTFLVAAEGELDLAVVPRLTESFAAIEGQGARRLIVDLTDVTFLDSTALGALLGEARRRRGHGDELVLVCDDPRTLRALDVTGLRTAFELHRTLRGALDAGMPA